MENSLVSWNQELSPYTQETRFIILLSTQYNDYLTI